MVSIPRSRTTSPPRRLSRVLHEPSAVQLRPTPPAHASLETRDDRAHRRATTGKLPFAHRVAPCAGIGPLARAAPDPRVAASANAPLSGPVAARQRRAAEP